MNDEVVVVFGHPVVIDVGYDVVGYEDYDDDDRVFVVLENVMSADVDNHRNNNRYIDYVWFDVVMMMWMRMKMSLWWWRLMLVHDVHH